MERWIKQAYILWAIYGEDKHDFFQGLYIDPLVGMKPNNEIVEITGYWLCRYETSTTLQQFITRKSNGTLDP